MSKPRMAMSEQERAKDDLRIAIARASGIRHVHSLSPREQDSRNVAMEAIEKAFDCCASKPSLTWVREDLYRAIERLYTGLCIDMTMQDTLTRGDDD